MEQGNASTDGCVHVAAHYDRNVFLSMLLAMGAPINELNKEGETPLQVAYKMVLEHHDTPYTMINR
jgi:ankyrin repeat protein